MLIEATAPEQAEEAFKAVRRVREELPRTGGGNWSTEYRNGNRWSNPMKRSNLASALVAVAWVAQALPATAAEPALLRSIGSLKNGSFYISQAKGDGVFELTDCKPFSGKALQGLKQRYRCAPDGTGFRCTSDQTLDVIFVLQTSRACVKHRKALLESEE